MPSFHHQPLLFKKSKYLVNKYIFNKDFAPVPPERGTSPGGAQKPSLSKGKFNMPIFSSLLLSL